MLSALRSTRLRPRRLPIRLLSTTPTVDETVNTVLEKSSRVLTEVPIASTSTPSTPHFMNIPPAEDPLLRLFTSCIMQDGERQKAEKTTSQVLLHLHAYTRQPPLELFRQALFNAAPAVRCMNQRRGPKAIVKPIPLSEKQRMRRAIAWIWDVVNVRSKSATTGRTLAERTAREMIKILNGDSGVLKKKEQVHNMALANRGSVRGR